MRQRFTVNIADVKMNIVCEETQEEIDAAVTAVDSQIRGLIAAPGHSCTRTEAAMLTALDHCTRAAHLAARVTELETFVREADPTGDTYGASLLRGENETLRGDLQISRGTGDALLRDNATLFGLNAKLMKQNAEANARADRMHDQVLSILTEVRELREKLAALCVKTPDPSPAFLAGEPAPDIEITPEEQQVTRKYEQLDLDDIIESGPGAVRALRHEEE